MINYPLSRGMREFNSLSNLILAKRISIYLIRYLDAGFQWVFVVSSLLHLDLIRTLHTT